MKKLIYINISVWLLVAIDLFRILDWLPQNIQFGSTVSFFGIELNTLPGQGMEILFFYLIFMGVSILLVLPYYKEVLFYINFVLQVIFVLMTYFMFQGIPETYIGYSFNLFSLSFDITSMNNEVIGNFGYLIVFLGIMINLFFMGFIPKEVELNEENETTSIN